jgi:hypothetical protein
MLRHGVSRARQWSNTVEDYNYMCGLAKRDWAWECLRRNTHYRESCLPRLQRGVIRIRLATGPTLTRLRARSPHAEAWGLCCFCRS